jgi:hypothetical protein
LIILHVLLTLFFIDLVRQKLIVEYDENGEIINTDDEDEDEEEKYDNQEQQDTQMNDNEIHIITKRPSIAKKNVHKNKLKQKTKSNLTTKDIIQYAMNQMRISDTPTNEANPPTLLGTAVVENPSSPSWHNNALPPTINSSATTTTDHSPLPAKLLPPSKFEQNIRGYELWTHEDDMVLLNHVLHHLHGGGWSELEVRFNGRHSARLCYARWRHLKSLLLKGITDKPHTPW